MTSFYDQLNGWVDGIIKLIKSVLALIGVDSDLAKLFGLKGEESESAAG